MRFLRMPPWSLRSNWSRSTDHLKPKDGSVPCGFPPLGERLPERRPAFQLLPNFPNDSIIRRLWQVLLEEAVQVRLLKQPSLIGKRCPSEFRAFRRGLAFGLQPLLQ